MKRKVEASNNATPPFVFYSIKVFFRDSIFLCDMLKSPSEITVDQLQRFPMKWQQEKTPVNISLTN